MANSFAYTSIKAPDQYNIRPSYPFANCIVINRTNYITTISTLNYDLLTGKKIISLTTGITLPIGTTVLSTDIENKRIYLSNEVLGESLNCAFEVQSSNVCTSTFIPLTGQDIHDNFFELSTAVIDHENRVLTIEGYDKVTDSENIGWVHYNGREEDGGVFYGGDPLVLTASSPFVSFTGTQSFRFAMDDGMSTPRQYQVDVPGTFANITDLVNAINSQLINNNTPFYFQTTDYTGLGKPSSGPYSGDWSTVKPYFFIWVDDVEYKIQITVDPGSLTGIGYLNFIKAEIESDLATLMISDKVEVTIVTSQFLRIYPKSVIRNKYDPANPGCTRIELVDYNNFLTTALYFDSAEITKKFDLTSVIQFSDTEITGNHYLTLTAIDPYFAIKFYDGDSGSANPFFSYTSIIINGSNTYYHSPYPTTNPLYMLSLNYGGIFRASGLRIGNGATIYGLSSLENLQVSGTVSISGASILDDLTAKSLIVEDTTVTTLSSTDTTDSSSIDSGAVIIAGGVGIAKNLYVGGDIISDTTITGDTVSSLGEMSASTYIGITDYDTLPSKGKLYKANIWTLENTTLNTTYTPTTDVSNDPSLNYDGDMSAYNLDLMGTLRVWGGYRSVETAPMGRFYTQGSDGTIAPASSGAIKCGYNGPFYANSLNQTSTRKAKENIELFMDNALDIINSVSVHSYVMKGDENKIKKIGFIAEETNPLLSTPTQNAMDMGNTVGLLIKAVQELSSRIKVIEKVISSIM